MEARDRAAVPPIVADSAKATGVPIGSADNGAAAPAPPTVSLPKGGGAIRGIGEKFSANPATGSGSLTVPLPASPGRGLDPHLSLTYDTGAGNGCWGLGWSVSVPSITRKTDKGVPRYAEDPDDVYVLSGYEDLVPMLGDRPRDALTTAPVDSVRHDGRNRYRVRQFRPRIEGEFARIERWTDDETGDVHWRSISRDDVTNLYGRDDSSRIANPADPSQVFSWLLCETRNDTGDAVVYEYKAEDDAGVDLGSPHEQNRTSAARGCGRHLKRVLYGNRVSTLIAPDPTEWLFELVFDYGEHPDPCPTPREEQTWACRADPFSTYRAGFEIRNYRLCRRALMFHHFPEDPETGADCLVRSLEFEYRGDSRIGEATLTVLSRIQQHGYRRLAGGGYRGSSIPALELTYRPADLRTELRTLGPHALSNVPAGVDGQSYQWVDLDGGGVPGILADQAGTWFYKSGLGDGEFGPSRPISRLPSGAPATAAGDRSSTFRLADVDGDGLLDLIEVGPATSGYYRRDDSGGWSTFVPFPRQPEFSQFGWHDPRLRIVDLSGDGLPDLMLIGDDVIGYYRGDGVDGFRDAQRRYTGFDEERGPRLVAGDPTEAIYLADMSGDGLADVVRIRNGDVCYWPSLGYGRFGAKVTMDRSPWLDEPDQFDPRRVRVADLDGSGTADLVYLHRDGVLLFANRSGNSFATLGVLDHRFPSPDQLSDVSVVDLLGQGTGCLVWTSRSPDLPGRTVRYVDLMGAHKPHLLTGMCNNLGIETRLSYAPSTRFYLADRAAGHPWLTTLPFAVHVLERVETLDRIAGNRFVTRYAYHHGFFDGVEREFRNFGMVEQWDSDEYAGGTDDADAGGCSEETVRLPPTLTKTWFHTGAYLRAGTIEQGYRSEYYEDPDAPQLADTTLPRELRRIGRAPVPWELTADDARQACRALHGSMLRQEVYALDGTAQQSLPYRVVERDYAVDLIQPVLGINPYGIYFVRPSQTFTSSYERALTRYDGRHVPDPRVVHEAVLSTDDYGTVLRSMSIAYGRRHRIPEPVLGGIGREALHRTRILFTDITVTNPVDEPDAFRAPLIATSRTWELRCGTPTHRYLSLTELCSLADRPAADLPYWDWDASADDHRPGSTARRLVEHSRVRYLGDDLSALLPPGRLERMALPGESLRLFASGELVTRVFGDRASDEMLLDAGFQRLDDGWWIPSGRVRYSRAETISPGRELAEARTHFFRPVRFLDPFGAATTARYDDYDLLLLQTEDALGNRISVGERDDEDRLVGNGNDYRVLAPRLISDANRNRVAVSFDCLGVLVGTARMGKPGERLGDSLNGFEPDLPPERVRDYFRDPLRDPAPLLAGATTRILYDPFAYQRSRDERHPDASATGTISRVTHLHELAEGEHGTLQHSFCYFDGLGRLIQTHSQVGRVIRPGDVTADHEWVSSGWTVFNDKGLPVRRYEPFFTGTHRFESGRKSGVSSMLCYDPVGRVTGTLHPDGTWEKAELHPWRQTDWDGCDTVLDDPRDDHVLGAQAAALLAGDPDWPNWYADRISGARGTAAAHAARQAAGHARTPGMTWLDPSGHPLATATHNRRDGADEYLVDLTFVDVEGNVRERVDAEGRSVERVAYSMTGAALHRSTIDGGERWVLPDVFGNPVVRWDSRGFRHRVQFDELRRPVAMLVAGTDPGEPGREVVTERSEYGESLPDGARLNLRTRRFRAYDASGVTTSDAYDFKGNLLATGRRLARDPRGPADWTHEVELQDRTFTSRSSYDALDRRIAGTAPDGSELHTSYDLAGRVYAITGRFTTPGALDPEESPLLTAVRYNARGQQIEVIRGNGARTRNEYDPLTFRLARSRSTSQPAGRSASGPVQDCAYTYDPVGNLTSVKDRAQQAVFFRNHAASAGLEYVYDAVYRLVEARGRENIALAGRPAARRVGRPSSLPGDGHALTRYVERYDYDRAGNLRQISHRCADPSIPGWRRIYRYDEHSPLQPGHHGNRLSGVSDPGDSGDPGYPAGRFRYDEHGNTVSMPGVAVLEWDHDDRLGSTTRTMTAPEARDTTYYGYDCDAQRTRVATVRSSRDHPGASVRRERVYVGAFELARRRSASGDVRWERTTVKVMLDQQVLALVETRTRDRRQGAGADKGPPRLVRYQLTDHHGSTTVELDDRARVITYEEYRPYGGTAYQAARTRSQAPKRYRFCGRERDSETGMYYYGARYYLPWIGRWASCDPAGLRAGLNSYVYCLNNPVNNSDPDGEDGFWHNAWEVTKGVGEGIGNVASGAVHMVAHPVATVEAVGHSMSQAYHEEGGGFSGVLMAANQLNPAYHAMVAGYEGYQAYERGDYRSMGREGFNTVFQTASTVAVAFGGAGLVSRGLGLGTAAAGDTGAVLDAASVTSRAAPVADTAADAVTATARASTKPGTAAPQIIRSGTDADLTTVRQLTGTATGKPLTFSVTEDAAESSITLGYRHRGLTQMGHNLVGVTEEGQTTWFHLNAPKGGTGVFTLADPVGESMFTTTMRVSPQAASRALSLAEDGLQIGRVPWTATGYNCATTVGMLLKQAGISVPMWARTPLLMFMGIRYGQVINSAAMAGTGEALSVSTAQQSQSVKR